MTPELAENYEALIKGDGRSYGDLATEADAQGSKEVAAWARQRAADTAGAHASTEAPEQWPAPSDASAETLRTADDSDPNRTA